MGGLFIGTPKLARNTPEPRLLHRRIASSKAITEEG